MPILLKIKPVVRFMVPGVIGFFLGRIIVFHFVSPFALAFVACWFGMAGFYAPALLTLLGVMSSLEQMYILKYFAAFAVMGIMHFTVGPRLRNIVTKAGVASGAALVAGLGFAAIRGMSAYFVMAAIIEAMFVFGAVIVLDRSVGALKPAQRVRMFAIEEQMSAGLLAAAVITGAADMRIGMLSLGWIFLCALIPAIVYKLGGSVGGSSALLLGVALYIGGRADHSVPAVLGIAAIVAGIFRGSKMKTVAGFISGLAASVLFTGSMPQPGVFGAALVGAVIFMLAPIEVYFDTKADYSGNEYLSRVKTVLGQRLLGFSHSFGKLSRTFSLLARPQTAPDKHSIDRLIDDIAENACHNCGRRTFCWERKYYETYRIMSGILSVCEEKNRIGVGDIPEGFRATCVGAAWLAGSINRMYETYRLNMYWQNRMAESRALISEQLNSVAKLVQSLASELDVAMNFKPDLEYGIREELTKKGIDVTQVVVLENVQERYEVSIRRRNCPGRVNCVKELSRIAGGVLGRKMRTEEGQCLYNTHNMGCTMRLVEEQKFRISSGVACRSKTGSPVSGDSHSFMELRDGQCLLALSDGMGSGEKAREESAAAVELLEDFIESGFEKDMAVKMINSVLVLRSEEDCFSTLDICSIDLHTGYAEFIKIGAAATYLLRDGEVNMIKSSSLPIGMLNTVDIEVSHRTLKENDLIIMVTDGITEAVEYDHESTADKGMWITQALSETSARTPQNIAELLLLDAEKRAGGILRDDMTVIAARIWQRN